MVLTFLEVTGVGSGQRWPFPLDFENFSKKGCFLSFEWEKTNLTTSVPPRKILEKALSGPPGRNSPDAHVRDHESYFVTVILQNPVESKRSMG